MADAGVRIRRLDSADRGFDAQLAELTAFAAGEDAAVDATVVTILGDVQRRGDEAVLEYTARFDGVNAVSVKALEVSADALQAALARLPGDARAALDYAAERIRTYHAWQVQGSWQYEEGDGTVLGQRITPLERVGLYVPGGRAAYPSSLLMNAIPARVAGVGEIIMVVPTPNGVRSDMVLAAAAIARVDRVFTI